MWKFKMENFLKEKSDLKDTNKQITYDGEKMLLVLQEIEFMLISLHKMGSYYFDKNRREYEKETTNFIDSCLICDRLAEIRTYLSSKFDLSLGKDEMDDIERACANVQYWTKPGEFLQKKWLK